MRTPAIVTILSDTPPSLEDAQRMVGGYVEMLQLGHAQLLVNEHGRLRNLPVNDAASHIAGQTIVGHAVLLVGTARWTSQSEAA